MKYFSMFSGIGGFELGIQGALESNRATQQADANIRHSTNDTSDTLQERRQSATCVGYSEIDKYAIATYERNFGRYEDDNQPKAQQLQAEQSERGDNSDQLQGTTVSNRKRGHRNYGDATKINAGELPDFDLLVGGFPCQAFSVAGKRKGFDDTRGTLFFDIARILSEKRPRHLVLENVKGLLSHDSGKTFQTIIGVLTDLGYFVEWQVLNSKDFGVPQNRERVFIVGHLGGEPRRKVFPIFGTDGEDTSSPTKQKRVRRQSDMYRHLTNAHVSQQHRGQAPGGDKPQESDSHTRIVQLNQPRIRRLTPLECERLQGFPDNWTVGSDTQRYKQCGNAVTVNVVEAVIGELYK